MKSLFNLMFDYAYKRELVDRYYARAFEVGREVKEQRQKEKLENYIFSSVGGAWIACPALFGRIFGRPCPSFWAGSKGCIRPQKS